MADNTQNMLLTGAQVVCYVNAAMFGRVSSINISIDSPRRKIHVIDTLQPVELAPMSVDVSGTMTVFKLKQDGGIEAVGLISKWSNLTFEKGFDLALVDRSTDTIIYHIENCSIESQRWGINTKGYVLGNIAFSGLLYNYHMN
jgi:hypothetical protein